MTSLLDLVRHIGENAGGTTAALEILLRVTVLLLAAMLVAIGLRRSSAAMRHLVWATAIVGALLIPPFSWSFPAWQWAILPQPRQASPASIAPMAKVATPEGPRQIAHSPDVRTGQSFDVPAMSPPAEVHSAKAPPATVARSAPNAASSAAVTANRTWSWPVLLAVSWAVGTSLGLARLGIGVVGAWRLARRARPVAESPWQAVLGQLRGQRGYRWSVEIRECPQVTIPMTWGLRRPVILVPAGSGAWSEETKRSVLLHELGHIRRRDCLVHLLGRLACVVYWFHPLLWLAARQLRKTSEQAADDVVLSSNIAPPDYAEHLVGIAAQMRGLHLFGHVALPMASPSDLENRVLAILDSRRNHRSLKRKTCYALMAIAAMALIPCALLRLGYAESSQDQGAISSAKSSDSHAAPSAASETASAKKHSPKKKEKEGLINAYGGANSYAGGSFSPPPPPPPVHLLATGKVLDASGNPVAAAGVYLRQWPASVWNADRKAKKDAPDILAQSQTDAKGQFRFENISARSTAGHQRLKQQPWDVIVVSPGSAIAWQHLAAPRQAAPMVFRLQPEAKITGRITDEEGRPLEGVEATVALISPLASGLFDFAPVPEFLDLHNCRLALRATTDAQGQVTLGGLPPDRRLALYLQRPGRRAGWALAATTSRPQPKIQGIEETPQGGVESALIPVQNSPFTATLKAARSITGTTVDAGAGKPLAGIEISAWGPPYPQAYPIFEFGSTPAVTSDSEGRFVFPDMPKRLYYVMAKPKEDSPFLGRFRIVAMPSDNRDVKLRIELPRGELLTGRVLDKKDGKPIPDAAVLYDAEHGYDATKWPDGFVFATRAHTDGDGRFRMLVPAGTATVLVSSASTRFVSYESLPAPPENTQKVAVVAGQPHPELLFSIALTPTNRGSTWWGYSGTSGSQGSQPSPYPFAKVRSPIDGKVLDSDGRPVAGAVVGLQPWFESRVATRDGNTGMSIGVDEKTLAKRFVSTDSKGRFSLRDVGLNESGTIQAVHKQRRLLGAVELSDPSRSGSAGEPLEVRLSPTGSVSGTVQKDGKPCRGHRVSIEEARARVVYARDDAAAEPDYVRGSGMDMLPSITSFRASTDTDAEGRFRFEMVPANRQFVVQIWPRGMTPEKNRYSVQVNPNENTEVPPFVFLPTNETVSGIVVDRQGKPVAGADISAWTGPNPLDIVPTARAKPTAADGRFTVTGLPKLTVILMVQLSATGGTSRPFDPHNAVWVRVQPGQKDVSIKVDPPTIVRDAGKVHKQQKSQDTIEQEKSPGKRKSGKRSTPVPSNVGTSDNSAGGVQPKWNVVGKSYSSLSGGFMGTNPAELDNNAVLSILPGHELLAQKAVLAKLNLTAKQQAEIFKLPREYYADMDDYFRTDQTNAHPQGKQKKTSTQWRQEERKVIHKRLEEILKPEQVRSLNDFIDAKIAYDRLMWTSSRPNFHFTKEQNDRLNALDEETTHLSDKRFEKTTKKLLAVLTPEQRILLREVALGPFAHGCHGEFQIKVEDVSDPLQVIILHPYPDFGEEKVQHDLQLTKDQKRQVQKILSGCSNATEKLVREQLRLSPEERKRLDQTLHQRPRNSRALPTSNDLAVICQRVMNQRKECWATFQEHPLVKMSVELRKQFESLLTPEQRTAYRDLAVREVAASVLYDRIIWNQIHATDKQQVTLWRISNESLANYHQFQLEVGAKLLKLLAPAQRKMLQQPVDGK